MSDIKLKLIQIDRVGRGIYEVMTKVSCIECNKNHWTRIGQRMRFDLDGDLHIKVDSLRFDIDGDSND